MSAIEQAWREVVCDMFDKTMKHLWYIYAALLIHLIWLLTLTAVISKHIEDGS